MISQVTTQIYRSGQHKLLGLEKREEHNEHKRQAICLPKLTSTEKATSPLRFPQREGYHEAPLASPNPPQRRIDAHSETPQKRGNTNILGYSTQRGHSTGDA
jgi:hypothetical protein